VLCHLQGLTHEAAARELGWPAGSMAKRLARAQELLRARLAGRGLTLSTATLAALLSASGSASLAASVPLTLGRAAVAYVAGTTTASAASAAAVALAGGALQTMSLARIKSVAGLVLGLVLLGTGAGAGLIALRANLSPAQPENAALALEANDPSPAVNERDAAERELRRKLDIQITLEKGIDPKTPLSDALEYLSDRYDLTISLDSKAFETGGVPKVREHAVQLPRMAGIRLSTALRLLLGQVQLDNGMIGGYRVNGSTLEIVPIEPSEPAADALPRKVWQRLLRPVGWPQGEARLAEDRTYGITFAETLDMIRARYGEKVTVDKQAFAAFRIGPLTELTVPARALVGDLCLCDILDSLGEGNAGRDYTMHYRIKPDTIELTAVQRGSAQEQVLSKSLEAVRQHRQAQIQSAKLTRKLEEPVDLEKGIEPNRLIDVLDFVADKWDVTIIVDSQAFAAAGIDKVEEVKVTVPAQQNVKLGTLLQQILDQVDKGDWTAQFNAEFALIGRDDDWRHRDFIEVAPLHKHVKHKKPLTEEQWTGFWDDLAQAKSGRVLLALDTLCRFPEQTVPKLRERLQAVAAPDPDKLARAARWIADLESDTFSARQKAAEELEKLGSTALQPLKKRLLDRPSLDLRSRVEQLVQKLEQPPTRDQLREVRAIHILEGIGTPQAEQVLETLAKGYAGALKTEKAKAALARLRY
jgi:hypothetical protein